MDPTVHHETVMILFTIRIHDVPFEKSLEMLMGDSTINIEGLVGGYTGPDGKTILPHQAQAKLDIRPVPDVTASDTLQKMKDHLAKHGYGDIEVTMSGGYVPTSTPADARIIKVEETVYKRAGIDPIILPRNARLVAGLRLHWRTAQAARWPLRPRTRFRRPHARRVLRHRIDESKGAGPRRRRPLVRRICVRVQQAVAGPTASGGQYAVFLDGTKCPLRRTRLEITGSDRH